MKLRRSHPPAPLDPVIAQFIGSLFYALEDNLVCCAQLTARREDGAPAGEIRGDALAGARRIAYVSRMTWEALTSGALDPDSIPQELLPYPVFEALARLGYALVALAEDDPEPEQLMTGPELDGLVAQYGIEAWMQRCRTRSFGAEEPRA